MISNAALHIPRLEETGYTREQLLDALAHDVDLPSSAVAVATLHAEEIEQEILALLESAPSADLDRPSSRLLFRGLHILGGRRSTAAYRPLIAFLRGPRERVDELLGDAALTETLPRILAGVFDDDPDPLLGLIADRDAHEFARVAALGVLAFLAFDGRVAPAAVEEFLIRFDTERMAPADTMLWDTWMATGALLGLDSLSARVRAAFADGRMPKWVATESDYDTLLVDAERRPNDPERFEGQNLGYLHDVVEALEGVSYADETDSVGDPEWDKRRDRAYDHVLSDVLSQKPARNPWRGVGRNDPCPCGSGKKFKKCCGGTAERPPTSDP